MAQITLNSTGVASSGTLALQSNGTTTAVTVDASQRVSIGGTTVTDTHLVNIQGSSASHNIGIVLNKTNSTAQIWGITNTGPLAFYNYTAASETARFDISGNLLVGVSSANANGGVLQLKSGITFPATAVAATDANTLDDYEEGTWTPTIQGNSGATGQVYATQNGTYTKIGRQVTLMFTCVLSTKGTLSGAYVQVKGFPFEVATLPNLTGGSPVYFTDLAQNWIYLSLQTEANATNAFVWGQTAASTERTYIPLAAIGNSTQLNCCLTYFI